MNIEFFSLLSLIANRLFVESSTILPSTIGKYRLSKTLIFPDHNNFGLGIYRSGRNQYFVKSWHGKWHDINYFNLKNEINIIEELNILNTNSRFKIPTLIEVIESSDSLIVIYEYLVGKGLDQTTETNQLKVLKQVEKWIKSFSPSKISLHDQLYFKLSLILSFLTLVVLEPSQIPWLIKYFQIVWQEVSIDQCVKAVFVHGDLKPDNIILTKQKIYVIDWENAHLSILSSQSRAYRIYTVLHYASQILNSRKRKLVINRLKSI